MAKSTDQINASKAGQTAESNGFGSQERPLRSSGVYQLKDGEGNVVDQQIVKVHPVFGDSQAAAFERVGYVYLRPAEKGEVKEIEVTAQPATASTVNASEDLKGIQARLSALEKENKTLRDEAAGRDAEEEKGSADGDVKAQAKAEAQSEANARVAERNADEKAAEAEKTKAVENEKNNSKKAGK